MALNSLFCAGVPLRNYSLTEFGGALWAPQLGLGRSPSWDQI